MRVVVTRPEAEAHAWGEALAAHGLDVAVLPLIGIAPASDAVPVVAAWRQLHGCTAVMFVSRAAVAHFFALRPAGLLPGFPGAGPGPRLWCAGPGSRAALLRAGAVPERIDSPDDSGQFDSEALWDVVHATVRDGDRVLVVRGGDAMREAGAQAETSAGTGRDWLAGKLRAAGAQVSFLMVYERTVPAWSPMQLALARRAATDGSVWLFTSAQALRHLALCAPDQDWRQARALATHARIAQAAREAAFGVVWESRPAIADVVASIESIR